MFNIGLSSQHKTHDAIGLELVTAGDGTLVYLEYLAYTVQAKAINAYLSIADHKEPNGSRMMWNRDLEIRESPDARYFPVLRRLKGGMDHVAIAHYGLAAAGLVPEVYFLTKDNSMPADFKQRLKQALPVGILDTWVPTIWEGLIKWTTQAEGSEFYNNVLVPLDSQGDKQIYELVSRDADTWARLLREASLQSPQKDAGAV